MSTILQKKIEHKTKQIENLLIFVPIFYLPAHFLPGMCQLPSILYIYAYKQRLQIF